MVDTVFAFCVVVYVFEWILDEFVFRKGKKKKKTQDIFGVAIFYLKP